ncbi:MAG: hypothetical protein KAT05_18180, partial [Spirochaetes bacterium]|nr:hypothetical protein [Spirochaetota bacterium]
MDKKYPLRRAKGIFVYDIQSTRYYDFQRNSNIIGYSNKKITTHIKNCISAGWNLYEDTVYHRRIKRLYEKIFSLDYYFKTCFSLTEFFARFLNYAQQNSFNLIIKGHRFKLWIKEYCNNIYKEIKSYSKNIIIYDMAEIFLESGGDIKEFNKKVKNLKKETITVFNYYWYPYLEINISDADIVILPQIYSGYFEYINILIKKDIKNYNFYSTEIDKIPCLYLAGSLKLYHTIKKMNNSEFYK